jgi:predicted RNA binding protein YcfA (HicA-like mRNA interferase family)
MPKVPRISGQDAIRAFEKSGFTRARTRGSHVILKKDGHEFLLSIPVHKGKTVGVGLLKSQIDSAGLTLEEFIELL